MNIVVHALGILHSVNIFCFCIILNWVVESLNRLSSFFMCALSNYFTLSPGLFTVNDPKDAISVVHVNKMLATIS